MANKKLLLGILAIVLLLIIVGCDTSGGGGGGGKKPSGGSTSDKISFTGGGFTLNIIKDDSRAISIGTGDRYEIRDSSNKVISKGSIKKNADGTYTFTPDSGKPAFYGTLSSNEASFQTGNITLDDGRELPGLSLSDNASANKETVYTSYKDAVNAKKLYNKGPIVNNTFDFINLMNGLPYTKIKLTSNLPQDPPGYGFNVTAIKDELGLQVNDYLKWDIEYKDHRILLELYFHGASHYSRSWRLVNEILIVPKVNGADYSSGTIHHVNYDERTSDESVITGALYGGVPFDKISINGKAPVDNLGDLHCYSILEAVYTLRNQYPYVGDYILWNITYSDSTWSVRLFIRNLENGYFSWSEVYREK
jgi:hypothetical protein